MKELTTVILETIWSIIGGICGGVWDGVTSLFEEKPVMKYNAKFEDIESHFSKNGTSFSVCGSYYAKDIASTFRNMIAFSSTGSGKTSSLILPSLYALGKTNASIVALDAGGDIYPNTSGYFESMGHKEFVLNWTDAKSDTFNAFDHINTIADIGELVNVYTANSGTQTKGDQFWESSMVMGYMIFIRLMVFHWPASKRSFRHLLNLIETYSATPQVTDKYFVDTHDEDLIRAYKAFNSTPEKTLQSILLTMRVSLKLLLDETICRNTDSSSFDLDTLRREKSILYLRTPINHLSYTATLTGTFLSLLLNKIMSTKVDNTTRPIILVLDECSLVKFNLSQALSQVRKYNAGILICVQDFASLQAIYTQAECANIRANCYYQVFLGHQPLSVCTELSRLLGKFSIADEDGKDSGQIRELLDIEQIRTNQDAIILAGGTAFKTEIVPFYKQSKLLKYSKLPQRSRLQKTNEN